MPIDAYGNSNHLFVLYWCPPKRCVGGLEEEYYPKPRNLFGRTWAHMVRQKTTFYGSRASKNWSHSHRNGTKPLMALQKLCKPPPPPETTSGTRCLNLTKTKLRKLCQKIHSKAIESQCSCAPMARGERDINVLLCKCWMNLGCALWIE